MKNKTKNSVAFVLVALSIASIQATFQQSQWKAPATSDQKKNPITSDETSVAAGKVVYTKECFSCHGKKGKGDGPASIALPIPAGDMSSKVTLLQSDGAIFWKIAEGKPPMPSFKKKLKEEQLWQVINYMRTLNVIQKK